MAGPAGRLFVETCVYFSGVYESGPDTCPFAPTSAPTPTPNPRTASPTTTSTNPSTTQLSSPSPPGPTVAVAATHTAPSSAPSSPSLSIHSPAPAISSASVSCPFLSHASTAVSPPSSPPPGSIPLMPGTIAGIVLGTLSIAALSLLLAFCLFRWRHRPRTAGRSVESVGDSAESVLSPRLQSPYLDSWGDATTNTPPSTLLDRDATVVDGMMSPVDGHDALHYESTSAS
ncbi:hypothetical protein MIND_01429200 [Mycena indigotica]|uniref:Uncharacterized protein n=1 Tax=Mycena indigotica TaxID=2126181 RepID=A0A8H6RZQ1_9AGAR|nr:uncharacterized protein MIND_01429200 [Mycena indigotica]KAF7288625.1 hypothetical protein MIND_01429200 [Mycena indigotica]